MTAIGRWPATTLCEGDHRHATAFAGLATRREARGILRRSRRIASALNGHSDSEEAVRAIYELLAQEGDLVGEFLEAIVARSFKGYASSPGGEGAPSAKTSAGEAT